MSFFDKTVSDSPFPLSSYDENGFCCLKKFMAPLIDTIDRDIERVAENCKSEDIFRCEFGIKQIQNLHTLENNSRYLFIADFIKKMLNKPDAKVMNMQYFIKYPGYKITSPHQDGAYFGDANKNIVTFWIPLQDVDRNSSCMFYVPGSHKGGLLEHKNIGTNVRTRTGKTGVSQYCEQFDMKDFMEVPMQKGDVLMHHQLVVHYSSMTHQKKRRIALTCIMEF